MFNPLHPFEPRFLELFKRKGVKAFVKQTYPRGHYAGEDFQSYVLTHFDSLIAARQYYDEISSDPNRELLILDFPSDVMRLKIMLRTAKIFTIFKTDGAEKQAKQMLDKQIRRYIEATLNWQPSRNEVVALVLDVQCGEIFATLKYHSKIARVKLDEIENTPYVL